MKQQDWSAWRTGEEEVRVQMHRPEMAKAFSKVKGVWLAGYSVAGGYMKLFHVKQSVPWVDAWMKEFMSHATSSTVKGKATT